MQLILFNEMLSIMFGKLQHEMKYVYITGDFNVNTLPNIRGNLPYQDIKNILSANLYSPLISKATRVTANSATLIDNIYCNLPER